MQQYLNSLQLILDKGFESKSSRDNMPPTKVYNDIQMRFDLTNNTLPIITTKQMPLRSIVGELLCFMSGETDVRKYDEMGCKVWWDNAYKWNIEDRSTVRNIPKEEYINGKNTKDYNYDYNLGRIYAAQWRNYRGLSRICNVQYVDQLVKLISGITNNPESRYHVMSAWNPTEMNNR